MLGSFDSTSILFLLLGKENPWIPWILLLVFGFQHSDKLLQWAEERLWNRVEYVLSGSIYTDKRIGITNTHFSREMEAFLHFLHTSKTSFAFRKCVGIHTGHCSITKTNYITVPASGDGVWIRPGIYAKFRMDTESSQVPGRSDDRATLYLEECRLTITLQAQRGEYGLLAAFLHECTTAYEAHCDALSTSQTLYIVKPVVSENRLDDCRTSYTRFESNKTFANLFFTGKDELLARLDQFKERATCPLIQRLGLPATLGLLLYGEPGTGKTSAIKAIANYMQMHLILVPMSKIRTRKELEELFYNKDVCYLPFEKRIYVFEEIDCNGWEQIVIDRAHRKEEEWDVCSEKRGKEDKKDKDKEKDKNDKAKLEEPLTLGALLEILDGIVESPGRMVIFTTNRRGILDPALIRPGRIDMELEFTRLTRADIAAIYQRLWDRTIEEDQLALVPDRRFTQAELSQLLYRYSQDPNKFLSALIEWTPPSISDDLPNNALKL